MEFGVFDHNDLSTPDQAAHYRNRLDLIQRYDEIGIHRYHLAEHHATPLGMASSPSVFLSAVAQRTKNLRFGPLVYCLPIYHPVRLLEEICMLDLMSNGRLELGVGRGISPIELGYYGVDWDLGPEMYREAFELILNGLANERLTHKGKYYSVDDMPMRLRPVQKPHPPLWYGIHTPLSVDWPAQNKINMVTNAPSHVAREITDAYREAYLKAGHKESDMPALGMTRWITIAESETEALEAGRHAYPVWRKSFMTLWDEHGREPVGVRYPDDFDGTVTSGQSISGTPQNVAEEIARHIEESGVNYFICRFAFGDLSLEESMRSVDLFAESVMPALANLLSRGGD